MKHIFLLISLVCSLTCMACQKDVPPTEEPPVQGEVETGFVAKAWNGYFVEEMAKAYEFFVENDRLPASVNVEGIEYGRGKMVAAGYMLIKKMLAEPDTWQDEEVEYNSTFSCPDNEKNNTLDVDEMSFDQFMEVAGKAYEYAEKNRTFPNYVTVNADYKDPADGSAYSTMMVINAISVGFTRIFHHYVEHNEFPETVSTWHTDYLRSVTNAPKDDPVVVAMMEEITKGLTTDMDKAKALFQYSLDEWEWEDYYNTGKGAVRTIQEEGGNCCDLSHSLVAMGRAAGIPARYRHAQCRYIKSGKIIGHVMAEYYVDGTWYLMDPSSAGTTFGNHEAWSVMETFNGRYNQLPF